MTEIYGRPHGPRVVRTPEGWVLTLGGKEIADLDATDLLWLKESMDVAVRSVLVDVLYGGRRVRSEPQPIADAGAQSTM